MRFFALPMTIALSLVLAVCLLAGCGAQTEPADKEIEHVTEGSEGETELSAEDVKKEAKEALEAAWLYALKQKEEYQGKVEGRLDELDTQIEELKVRAEDSKEEARVRLEEELEELEMKREAAREKLGELQKAGAQAWKDIKSELDAIMDDLEDFLKRLIPPSE